MHMYQWVELLMMVYVLIIIGVCIDWVILKLLPPYKD